MLSRKALLALVFTLSLSIFFTHRAGASEANYSPELLQALNFDNGKIIEKVKIIGNESASLAPYYDKKIEQAYDSKLTLNLNDKEIEVENCREYLDLKSNGAQNKGGTMQQGYEVVFKETCGGLEILTHSQKTYQNRFFSDLGRNVPAKEYLERWPAALIDLSSYESPLCPIEVTVGECLKKIGGTFSMDDGRIIYDGKKTTVFFRPLVVGDFNGDNEDDLALFYNTGVKGGSLSNSGIICMEKNAENQFKIIDCIKKD